MKTSIQAVLIETTGFLPGERLAPGPANAMRFTVSATQGPEGAGTATWPHRKSDTKAKLNPKFSAAWPSKENLKKFVPIWSR
jgi:hypothetical protein